MEYIEDVVEEVQSDGSIVLRRVIVPTLSQPSTVPSLDYDVPFDTVPMGDPVGSEHD